MPSMIVLLASINCCSLPLLLVFVQLFWYSSKYEAYFDLSDDGSGIVQRVPLLYTFKKIE